MPTDFLQPLAEVVFQVVFYYFGRVVVPHVSLGRWSCEPLLSELPKARLRWGGIFHYRGNRIFFTSEGTALIGFLSCAIVIGTGLLFRYMDK